MKRPKLTDKQQAANRASKRIKTYQETLRGLGKYEVAFGSAWVGKMQAHFKRRIAAEKAFIKSLK